MSIKKVVIYVLIFMSVGILNISSVEAEDCGGENASQNTGALAEGCINAIGFTINTNSLTPGGKKVIEGTADGLNGSTEKTVNAALGVIIKNLIVVFGVLALGIMTIGGGYMIFHSGEESLLSRGKTIFLYGLISLVVALSAGLLIQLVTYVFYK